MARVRAGEKRDIRETVIGYAALTRASDFVTRILILVQYLVTVDNNER